MQGGLRHAGTCLPAELGGKSTERLGRLREDEGGFAVAETRCHRGVKPPSKRQTDREQGAGFIRLLEHAGRQADSRREKKEEPWSGPRRS